MKITAIINVQLLVRSFLYQREETEPDEIELCMLVETSTATDCAKLSNIFATSSVLLLDTWDVPPRFGFRDILGCPNLSHLGLGSWISWDVLTCPT